MLTDGLSYLFDGYWWMVYPPAIILIITVIASTWSERRSATRWTSG